jgi:leucyl aminopeptidase
VLNPPELTRRARAAGRKAGLTVRVLAKRDLERLGLTAMLAVARGSAVEPRLVHMTYRPKTARGKGRAARRGPKVVLVGKGVTFDSGGLNLKPGASMLDMKCDMAGAGAVIATMTALAEAGCAVEVHGLVGLVENMTGGAAYKPGDILRTYLGKTVEVGNTDAEGRLVLADVLAYAVETLKPDVVVDLATLTGACVVALGTGATGLFTRDDDLADALRSASGRAGERVWRLPMYDAYLESLQGGPADLKNVGDRWGGAITAALFLGEFVPRDLSWAHLDIAGPAFRERPSAELRAGGTGAGVRTLLHWLETFGPGRRP